MFRHTFFRHHLRNRIWDCAEAGGGHRRGPKLFDAGSLRYVVLQLIAERPRHGYEIIKEIEQRIGGGYSPSPGVIYPLLAMLQDEGFVTVTPDGSKNLHTITPEGKAFLEENRAYVDAIMTRMSAKDRSGFHDIRQSLHELKRGLLFNLRGKRLTPEQTAKIRDILKRTIDELNAIKP
jgi:DNA-binding PadR family transcriptional regulator